MRQAETGPVNPDQPILSLRDGAARAILAQDLDVKTALAQDVATRWHARRLSLRSPLDTLAPQLFKAGTVLFRPGDAPFGFVLIISGRVNVFLNSRTGRELLLYSVDPGETCVQTTLGLLGAQSYTGEAIADTVELTMRGQTRPVTLTARIDHDSGTPLHLAEAPMVRLTGEISRAAFGATGYAGLVGDRIRLDVDAPLRAV